MPPSRIVGPDGRPLKKERRKSTPKTPKTPAPVTTTTVTGTPNISEAPVGYRRLFRFSQLAVGEAGAGRSIDDIWATFLQELEDIGIPEEARSRLRSLGAKKVLGPAGIGKGVTAALNKENLAAVKETLTAAKGALKGVKGKSLTAEWDRLLKSFAGDPQFADENGRRILEELKKLNPATVTRVGSNQTLSALARRGDDPFVVRMFNKAMKRPSSAVLPEGITATLTAANAGKLPQVTGQSAKALAKGGLQAGGFGRKVAGVFGKGAAGPIGAAIGLGFEANRAAGILGRESRAKKLALQGFQGVGPSSSTDFLRNIVGQQEAVARRKVTMQRFEPELFQEVVRVLSDTGGSQNTLTSTERRIGADAEVGVTRRGRSGEDVQFLLDQLFNQMGGQ